MGQENVNLAQPIILAEGGYAPEDLVQLRQEQPLWREVDIYESQLAELFEVLHPDQMRAPDVEQQRARFVETKRQSGGAWVYYPWSGQLIHTVSEQDLSILITNRNKNLVTEEEQKRLRKCTVGILGLSVGNGMALAMAYSGIGTTLKIADFDTLETCNLNRLRAGIQNIGTPKITIAAQQIYEANPYMKVAQFPQGVQETDLEAFFGGDSPLQVVFDEIDDFKMKIKLRLHAKKHHIPVLMFTSLGDSILVDIERYDEDENLQPFHGLIGEITEEILEKKEITPDDIRRFSVQVVGAEYIPTPALKSVTEMGKRLVGRPQLYSTVAIDGGLAAYVVRQIMLENSLRSGRHLIKFSDLFGLQNQDLTDSDERKSLLNQLR